jgi:hypothetical protein
LVGIELIALGVRLAWNSLPMFDWLFVSPTHPADPHAQDNKVRDLAITGRQRLVSFQEIGTLREPQQVPFDHVAR